MGKIKFSMAALGVSALIFAAFTMPAGAQVATSTGSSNTDTSNENTSGPPSSFVAVVPDTSASSSTSSDISATSTPSSTSTTTPETTGTSTSTPATTVDNSNQASSTPATSTTTPATTDNNSTTTPESTSTSTPETSTTTPSTGGGMGDVVVGWLILNPAYLNGMNPVTFMPNGETSTSTGPSSPYTYQNGYPTINGNYVDCYGNVDNDPAHHSTDPSDFDPGHHSGQNCAGGQPAVPVGSIPGVPSSPDSMRIGQWLIIPLRWSQLENLFSITP